MIDDSNFTTSNSLIMLVDHQTGTIGWVKSLPQETVITSCRVLTRMALAYEMPLVLTTTVEEQVGPTMPDIKDLAPDAWAHRYARGGQLGLLGRRSAARRRGGARAQEDHPRGPDHRHLPLLGGDQRAEARLPRPGGGGTLAARPAPWATR